jgi:hypothetical protein
MEIENLDRLLNAYAEFSLALQANYKVELKPEFTEEEVRCDLVRTARLVDKDRNAIPKELLDLLNKVKNHEMIDVSDNVIRVLKKILGDCDVEENPFSRMSDKEFH